MRFSLKKNKIAGKTTKPLNLNLYTIKLVAGTMIVTSCINALAFSLVYKELKENKKEEENNIVITESDKVYTVSKDYNISELEVIGIKNTKTNKISYKIVTKKEPVKTKSNSIIEKELSTYFDLGDEFVTDAANMTLDEYISVLSNELIYKGISAEIIRVNDNMTINYTFIQNTVILKDSIDGGMWQIEEHKHADSVTTYANDKETMPLIETVTYSVNDGDSISTSENATYEVKHISLSSLLRDTRNASTISIDEIKELESRLNEKELINNQVDNSKTM